MDDVEEAKEKVESDMKSGLRSDRSNFHEAGAVVLVLRLKEDLEEEEEEEGPEDDGDDDGRGEGEAEEPLEGAWLEKHILWGFEYCWGSVGQKLYIFQQIDGNPKHLTIILWNICHFACVFLSPV